MEINEWVITLTEMIGITAASLSGSMIAIERKLDMFGVLFLGMISALGGGVVRDLLLGYVPPHFFTNYRGVLTAVLVSFTVFIVAKRWNGWRNPNVLKQIGRISNIFDSIGLAAFSVSGAQVAIAMKHGDNAFLCVFMGMTTGIGGGVLRDMMSRETPYVLRKHIYAVASIAGVILYWTLFTYTSVPQIAMPAAMVLIISIRILATVFHWELPHINTENSQIPDTYDKEGR